PHLGGGSPLFHDGCRRGGNRLASVAGSQRRARSRRVNSSLSVREWLASCRRQARTCHALPTIRNRPFPISIFIERASRSVFSNIMIRPGKDDSRLERKGDGPPIQDFGRNMRNRGRKAPISTRIKGGAPGRRRRFLRWPAGLRGWETRGRRATFHPRF